MNLIFENCCGCIELRTGCLVIGYLELIAEVIVIILCSLGVAAGGVVTANGNYDEALIGGAVLILSAVMLVLTLLFFIFTVVLLVGLHQSKRGHVKAYLVFAVIFIVLTIISWLASFSAPVLDGVSIASNLLGILVNIYFLLVIRSYYYKLDEQVKAPGVYGTA